MTSGHDLLASIIREGGNSRVAKLKPELFIEEEIPAFKLFENYYYKTGQIPPFDLFERKGIFLDRGIEVPGDNKSFTYNYLKALERAQFNLTSQFIDEIKNTRNLDKSKELIQKTALELSRFDIQETSYDAKIAAENMFRELEHIRTLKENGISYGIFSGWKPLDDLTGGYKPTDLIVFAGRRGTGKTYILCRQILKCIIDRKKVILVTTEMQASQMMRRLIGMRLKINPKKIVNADVSREEYDSIQTTTEEFEQYRFVIVEALGRRVDEVVAEIKDHEPDIVFIDGSYLLMPSDKYLRAHWEKQAHVHQFLKSNLALQSKIPVVCSVQQNRASKNSKDGDGIVAGSDVIEQLASLLVSVQYIKGNSHRRLLDIVKNREDEEGLFVINYCFSDMNFAVDEDETRRQREIRMNGAARQDQEAALHALEDDMR